VSRLKILDWQSVHDQCDRICQQIRDEGDVIDSIVGVSRGGLIPAVIISQTLNVRDVYSIGVKSYDEYDNCSSAPKPYQSIDKKICKRLNKDNHTVLIVDDISDKGMTFRCIRESTIMDDRRMCSLYIKRNTTFIPRYYGDVTDEWVVFPWEVRKS
jgi:hypoxanthine phosphoribosyltransferase